MNGQTSKRLNKLAKDHGLKLKTLKRLWKMYPKNAESFDTFELMLLDRIYK